MHFLSNMKRAKTFLKLEMKKFANFFSISSPKHPKINSGIMGLYYIYSCGIYAPHIYKILKLILFRGFMFLCYVMTDGNTKVCVISL